MLIRRMYIFKPSIVPDVTLWNGITADVPEENVQVQLDLECMLLHSRKSPLIITGVKNLDSQNISFVAENGLENSKEYYVEKEWQNT